MLRVAGLGVTVRDKAILHDVSFDVARGQHVAVIGPNGAGKTTLLRCIGRLLSPTAGSIHLGSSDVADRDQRSLAREMAYVPQASDQQIVYTVEAFLLMARYAHLSGWGQFSEQDHAAVAAAASRTGVTEFLARPLNTLSGGERQAVYIAAALAQEAPLLLLDEPTTFLDYRHQESLIAVLESVHREDGKTLITVTHDLNQGAMRADHVVALREGTVAFQGAPDDVITAERLEALYDLPFTFVTHPETGARWVLPAGRGGAA
jgi:iron complex transport system ATP-binding protein